MPYIHLPGSSETTLCKLKADMTRKPLVSNQATMMQLNGCGLLQEVPKGRMHISAQERNYGKKLNSSSNATRNIQKAHKRISTADAIKLTHVGQQSWLVQQLEDLKVAEHTLNKTQRGTWISPPQNPVVRYPMQIILYHIYPYIYIQPGHYLGRMCNVPSSHTPVARNRSFPGNVQFIWKIKHRPHCF